jgi:hypothetical protein
MSLRPASVDAQGGPMTGKEGGPMSLAKPAINWSHVTGKRHGALLLILSLSPEPYVVSAYRQEQPTHYQNEGQFDPIVDQKNGASCRCDNSNGDTRQPDPVRDSSVRPQLCKTPVVTHCTQARNDAKSENQDHTGEGTNQANERH